jgi:hypothetical protein
VAALPLKRPLSGSIHQAALGFFPMLFIILNIMSLYEEAFR